MDPKDLIDGGFLKKSDLLGGAPEPASDPSGESFGRYQLLSVLGQGGSSTVFHARDLLLNRDVALKKLKMESGSLAGRFLREAELLAKLHHPSIVPVFDLGRVGESVFFTMPLIEGHTLQEVILTKRPAAADAARMIKEAAEAVQYAHDNGIIHRDLKPSNLMLDASGRVLVTDFGLGRREGEKPEKRETATGVFMGTLYYMSPEQARGDWARVDGRSDVYSLGATLYETLTGHPPFDGDSAFEILRKISQDEPKMPGRVAPGTPWDLEVICLRALEKEPERRYASMREFAEDLGRFLRGEPVLAKRASLVHRLRRRAHRNRAALVTTAAALLLLSATWIVQRQVAVRNEAERVQLLESIRRLVAKSIEGYEQGLKGPPENRDAARADLAKTESFLEDVLRGHAELFEAREQIARIRRIRGRAGPALEAINAAIAQAGKDAPGRFFLERAMIRAALWEEEEGVVEILPAEDRRARLDEAQGAIRAAVDDMAEARGRKIGDLPPGRDLYYEAFTEYTKAQHAACRALCDSIIAGPIKDYDLIADALKLRARSAMRAARYAEAAEDYAKSWDIRRCDREAYVGEGFARLHQLQLDETVPASARNALEARVLDAAEKIRIIDPGHTASGYLRAWLFYYRAELAPAAGIDPRDLYSTALVEIEQSLERRPDNLPAINLRGLVRRGAARQQMRLGRRPMEDIDRAIADFTTCLDANPKYATARGNRGCAHLDRARLLPPGDAQMKEYDAAIADCLEAVRLKATKPSFYSNLALAHSEKAQAMAAAGSDPMAEALQSIRDYDAFLERWPAHERAWHNRANVKLIVADWRSAHGGDATREYEPALEDYDKAVSLNPRYVEALVNRGLARMARFRALVAVGSIQKEDIDLAFADFSRVLDLKPDSAVALANRGLIHSACKRWRDAVNDLEKALKADPNLPEDFRKALDDSRRRLAEEGF